ncbi:MAG: hypothetical protein P0Y64_16725 [Candidatus Sphingomonas colombiensis]|nr:hypothetical protein [Sphingomonas sp.]WEK42964.1 MAG: hypothetical protein P0Y64_16725 [Sphingomonas sp.]
MTPALPNLALPVTETFEDWSNLGRRLCMGARTINWLIGDWLIEGSERFGEKARDEANQIFRSDVDRFGPIVDTCRRFTEPRRHPALTFGHHLAVMSIADDTEADGLLAKAETERLTTAALKAEVRLTFHQPRMLEDDDPEDTAMRHIAQAWNRAPKASREAFIELAQESHLGVIDL